MREGEIVGGRFVVEGLAGEGGMGAVFRARDRSSGEWVAIKVLRDAGADEVRFTREAEVLAELGHPGVVRFVAQGKTPSGELFFAMEWLEGMDLAARLAEGPLGVPESAGVVAQLADALASAHARGVVHRDIKPSNVFLVGGDLGEVRLLDFGIARVRDFAPTTRTGAVLGTPGYMAPEQARGDRDVDARADVFSLGCVWFECLAGRPAFAGSHVLAVLAKILLEEAPSLAELRPDVPADVADLVARMLAKQPDERPSSAAEVARRVRALGTVRASLRPPRAPMITTHEQRLLCVVLAGQAQRIPSALANTVPAAHRVDDPFDAIAKRLGGRAVRVADGSVLVTLHGRENAEDQAVAAARCAIALRERLPECTVVVATGQGELAARVPVGPVIERAVAMLRACPRDEAALEGVWVDALSAGLLERRFRVEAREGVLLLRGEIDVEAGARTLLGKRVPCLGRDVEIATLEGTFDRCVSESVSRAVLVTGPPGVGKSRVREELVARVRRRWPDADVWIARGDAMRAGAPSGLASQLVRRMAGVQDGEPAPSRREKVFERCARILPAGDVARVAGFLCELIGAPVEGELDPQLEAARRSPILMSDQTRRACVDFLAAETHARPVLIVYEDLHWGDRASIRAVEAALRALPDRPWMVLALARPEVHDQFRPLWSDCDAQEIRLAGLTRRAAGDLVRRMLGESVGADAIDRIVERAAGNAFHLEELIRAAGEGRAELPETVLATIQARLETLEPAARRVLRAASIYGRVFWDDAVRALLGERGALEAAQRWIDELVRREMLTARAASRFPGTREYAFRHALVLEAVRQTLVDDDARVGHRLAAEWLERAGETDPAVVAEHLERGDAAARAIEWHVRAAHRALDANDFAAVITRADRAIACGADGELAGVALLFGARARFLVGDLEGGRAAALDALARLRPGSEPWCTCIAQLAAASGHFGDGGRLFELAEALLAREPESGAGGAWVAAAARTALYLQLAGDRLVSERLLDRMATSPHADATRDPAASALVELVRAMRALCAGEPDAYVQRTLAAVEAFERVGDVRNALQQRANAGHGFVQVGQHARAIDLLRACLEEAQRLGADALATSVRQNLGLALARSGALEEASDTLERAIASAASQGSRRLEAAARTYLAEVLEAAGDLARAEEQALRAIEIAAGVPTLEAQARARLARVRLARGDATSARTAASDAIAVLDRVGSLDEGESFVRLAHAEALFACGERDAARAAIAKARDRLFAIRDRIVDETWRRSFVDAIPDHARTLGLAQAWCAEPT